MTAKGLTGFKAFLLVWFGQMISLTGSGLTGFALGVWVYLRTGSATLFALISLFANLPMVLLGPIAGALVDRWDRRKAMLLSDGGAALCTLAIFILLSLDRLEIWHIYLLTALTAGFATFQWLAYSAATTLLVPKEQYGRASGMVQLAEGVAQIAAPVMAGALMSVLLVQHIISIDIATFLFALFTLMLVRVPRPPLTPEGQAAKGGLLREAVYGWTYIRERKGLLALLLLFAVVNLATAIVQVLVTPLILGFSTPLMLGTLLSVAGLGFLAGSLLMSLWGGPKRKMTAVYIAELLVGLGCIILGLTTHPEVLGIGGFLALAAFPIVVGCAQAIWLRKTAPDVQGRVFSFRRVISWSSLPVAYLAAGPLADYVFNPLLVEGGALAGSLGRVVGIGPTRGIGLIFIIMGLVVIAATVAAYTYPNLRQVEVELPDMALEGI